MTREQAMLDARLKANFANPLGSPDNIATAGADAERARVVAWLRWKEHAADDATEMLAFSHAADAIDRGEHWRGE